MKTALRLVSSLESIRPHMERVERLLHETLAKVEEPLGSMLRCSLGSGKRIRPALVVLAGQVFAPSTAPFYSLAAAVEMAGILAGVEGMPIAALRRFGRELGMAFQIVDDVLDFIGDETQLGKPAGGDLCQGLVTLPTLFYLERVEDGAPVNAVLSGHRDAGHVQTAIEAVCSSGAIEAAPAEARAYARQNQEALATLPDNVPRQMLCSLAEYVVERRH